MLNHFTTQKISSLTLDLRFISVCHPVLLSESSRWTSWKNWNLLSSLVFHIYLFIHTNRLCSVKYFSCSLLKRLLQLSSFTAQHTWNRNRDTFSPTLFSHCHVSSNGLKTTEKSSGGFFSADKCIHAFVMLQIHLQTIVGSLWNVASVDVLCSTEVSMLTC